jgi:hypothetical protein
MSTPYMTAPEAALFLCFRKADGTANVNALYQWRLRNPDKLPAYRRGGGRVLLFRRADVELALEREGAEKDAFLRRVR